jgi:uncharacterized phage protein (TIGR02220 family)
VRNLSFPEIFFKSIAEKGNLYSRLWMYWLGTRPDDLFEPNFCEIEILKLQGKIDPEKLREIYQYGIQFLQQDFKITKKKSPRAIAYNEFSPVAHKIIDLLNELTGSRYEYTDSNVNFITARMKEGYGYDDFEKVIRLKIHDWKGTEQEKYLRPSTLFNKEKFENYLNGATQSTPKSKTATFFSQAERAKQLIGLRND